MYSISILMIYFRLIKSCLLAPVKLFSERYLTSSPLDEIRDLPELLEDSNSTDEVICLFLNGKKIYKFKFFSSL